MSMSFLRSIKRQICLYKFKKKKIKAKKLKKKKKVQMKKECFFLICFLFFVLSVLLF
jgi:hypothetical protein